MNPHGTADLVQRIIRRNALGVYYHAPRPALTLRTLRAPIRTIELTSNRWIRTRLFRTFVRNDAPLNAQTALRLLAREALQPSLLNPPCYALELALELMTPAELSALYLARRPARPNPTLTP